MKDMSTKAIIPAVEDPTDQNSLVWRRLRAEKADICEALLKEYRPTTESQAGTPGPSKREAIRTENWHRELLLARLRKADDALDRLMWGSYGDCCRCGRWIEDPMLDCDPAVAFCSHCWERMQMQIKH
jgi:RNA polymerase-binding transcription factor DksA